MKKRRKTIPADRFQSEGPALNDIDHRQPRSILFVTLIAILCFIAYANSLSGEFVWDDAHLIKNNKRIESFANIKQVLREDTCYMLETPTGYYRPLQIISYMADYSLWKKNPFGYHLTGIFIQMLNSILAFYLCFLITANKRASFFTAAIFCVHPAFVPIVGYISGRADLIGAFFLLLTVYIAIRFAKDKKGSILFWLTPLFYLLALLSKEYYIITPLFIVMYMAINNDEERPNKQIAAVLLAMACMFGLYLFARFSALHKNYSAVKFVEYSLPVRLHLIPYAITNYIGTLFLPFNLSVDKVLTYKSLTEARFIISYLSPIAVGCAAYYFFRKSRKNELFFIGWFLLGILPVANIFPLKSIWAPHWAYIPAVGFLACLIYPIFCYEDRSGHVNARNSLINAMLAAFIAFLTILTVAENRCWKNDEAIAIKTYLRSSDSERANVNMAKIYAKKGEYKKALELYSAVIKNSRGQNAEYIYLRGTLYRNMGDFTKAREDFEAAIALDQSEAVYHNDLGGIYGELGMLDKARQEWNRTLELDPKNENARKNLQVIGSR